MEQMGWAFEDIIGTRGLNLNLLFQGMFELQLMYKIRRNVIHVGTERQTHIKQKPDF